MLRGVSFVSLRRRIRIRNSIVWEAQSSGCLPGTFFNAVLNSTLNNPLSWLCIPEPESQGITFERCKPCILVSSTFAFHVEGTQQIFDTKISPYGLAEDPFLICGWWPTTCLHSSLLQNLSLSLDNWLLTPFEWAMREVPLIFINFNLHVYPSSL